MPPDRLVTIAIGQGPIPGYAFTPRQRDDIAAAVVEQARAGGVVAAMFALRDKIRAIADNNDTVGKSVMVSLLPREPVFKSWHSPMIGVHGGIELGPSFHHFPADKDSAVRYTPVIISGGMIISGGIMGLGDVDINELHQRHLNETE